MRRGESKTTPTGRRRFRLAAVVAAVVAAVLAAGCDGPPANADKTLTQLANIKLLTTPPPGGVLVAHAEDHGSVSSINGRPPGLINIYATTGTVSGVATYYQQTYPQDRINADCCVSAAEAHASGQDGWAYIAIDISSGPPSLAPYHTYKLKVGSAPAGHPTYVVIEVFGQPPVASQSS